MILKEARVRNYKSIKDSTTVNLEEKVTVFVGKNESGKTAFLEALYKTLQGTFEEKTDYPRKYLAQYKKQKNPDLITELKFELSLAEIEQINQSLGFSLFESFSFVLRKFYDQNISVDLNLSERAVLEHDFYGEQSLFVAENRSKLAEAKSLQEAFKILEKIELSKAEQAHKETLEQKFLQEVPSGWDNLLNWYIWNQYLAPNLPKFVYFSDYQLLPDQINLSDLYRRFKEKKLTEKDRSILNLLEISNIQIQDLLDPEASYESLKTELEAVSIEITDRIFSYWKQDPDLEVEFDLKQDYKRTGVNLYLRIKNKRHRVTVPFQQRSRGFIWFFSFIILFDCIRKETQSNLIVLLDEPGLNLHGLAQKDLSEYIKKLSSEYQVIYTTHSSYMIDTDQLEQVRTVFDQQTTGTVIQDELRKSPTDSLTPIKTALGNKIIDSLAKLKKVLFFRNSLEYFYLKFFSSCLFERQKQGLNSEINLILVPEFTARQSSLDLINQREDSFLRTFEITEFSSKNQIFYTIEDLISPKLLAEAIDKTLSLRDFSINPEKLRESRSGVLAKIKEILEFSPKTKLFFNEEFRSKIAEEICSQKSSYFDETTCLNFERLSTEINSLFEETKSSKNSSKIKELLF